MKKPTDNRGRVRKGRSQIKRETIYRRVDYSPNSCFPCMILAVSAPIALTILNVRTNSVLAETFYPITNFFISTNLN